MPSDEDSEVNEVPAESMSPFGVTNPIQAARLKEAKDPSRDPECIIMRMWADECIRDPCLNFGAVPLDRILHRCTEKCIGGCDHVQGGPLHDLGDGNLDGQRVRDVAATIQWLGTNVGRCFVENFLREYYDKNTP